MPRAKVDEESLAVLLDAFFLKDDLKGLLEAADLPVGGTKDVLIDRLIDEGDYSPAELLNYHYKDELKDWCDEYDLPVSGSKAELVDRLVEFFGVEFEEAEEEEEPKVKAKTQPEPRPPRRMAVPAVGVIGTEDDFLSLIRSIEGWSPRKRHRTEEGYVMDLEQYLVYECGYQCRLEGEQMADIVVNGNMPVEVKKNPTQSEYDRMLGQLTRMHRAKNFAIGVVCDVRRLEIFQDFKQTIGTIFEDGSVAIIHI